MSNATVSTALPNPARPVSVHSGNGVGPSALYAAHLWRAALTLTRPIPRPVLIGAALAGLNLYQAVAPRRRRIVRDNLLPVIGGNGAEADRLSRRLFRQFGTKLIDLWSYENGQPIDGLIEEIIGWDHLIRGHARKQGVLLLTVHLGNWEFGAPLITRHGLPLSVVSLAEPDAALTRLRSDARLRWGVETIVVGDNPFGSVEILHRLSTGGVVAILVDRPPAISAVEVQLFGRAFRASMAAAELARASGCVLLPVLMPRGPRGYRARILPEIAYDRRELSTRAARVELTQRILDAFTPAIAACPDQWYHFVPLWPVL